MASTRRKGDGEEDTNAQREGLIPAGKAEQAARQIKDKGRAAIEKKANALERLVVEYVPTTSLKPNSYNPNRQSEHDFNLLLRSMEEDGFTQPVVALKDGTIVDGEHRWRAAQALGFAEVPVVHVDMTPEQAKIATLRHNRARGSEDVELSAEVLRDLEKMGAGGWAMDSLMLDQAEWDRMIQDIPAPEVLAAEEYGQAWVPDKTTGDVERAAAERGDTKAQVLDDGAGGHGVHVSAMSDKAITDQRAMEQRIQEAKTHEERQQLAKESKLYRISLIFSGDESELVQSVLGDTPAVTLVQFCRLYGAQFIAAREAKSEAKSEAEREPVPA